MHEKPVLNPAWIVAAIAAAVALAAKDKKLTSLALTVTAAALGAALK